MVRQALYKTGVVYHPGFVQFMSTALLPMSALASVVILLWGWLCIPATATSAVTVELFGKRMERRALSRMRLSCPSSLTRVGGKLRDFPVRCAHISPHGALVISKQAIKIGSVVVLGVPHLCIWGEGRVRHCRRLIFQHSIGIEFGSDPRCLSADENG